MQISFQSTRLDIVFLKTTISFSFCYFILQSSLRNYDLRVSGIYKSLRQFCFYKRDVRTMTRSAKNEGKINKSKIDFFAKNDLYFPFQ